MYVPKNESSKWYLQILTCSYMSCKHTHLVAAQWFSCVQDDNTLFMAFCTSVMDVVNFELH